MNYLRKILESVIDPTQEGLDPELFEGKGDEWTLRPEAQSALLDEAEEFRQFGTLESVYLVGSMLSKQWLPWSDLDLHLILQADEQQLEAAKALIKEKGEELLEGTRHPIQIYVESPETFKEEKYTGILDLETGEMLKGPYDISADVTQYMEGFTKKISEVDLKKAELVRDLIDYDLLKKFNEGDRSDMGAQIKAKIAEIDEDVNRLSDMYQEIRDLRGAALSGDPTPEEIKQWGHGQLLPGNVEFKLMERYAYKSLLSELKRIGEDGAIDEPEEVDQVMAAVKDHAILPESGDYDRGEISLVRSGSGLWTGDTVKDSDLIVSFIRKRYFSDEEYDELLDAASDMGYTIKTPVEEADDQRMADLEDVVMADPDNYEAHVELGQLYAAKGWKRKAEECFERALALDPDNSEAEEGLRSLYRKSESTMINEKRETTSVDVPGSFGGDHFNVYTDSGLIADPGKFEGEPIWTPYFYNMSMEFGGDEVFEKDGYTVDMFVLDDEDKKRWPELANDYAMLVWTDDQGFTRSEAVNEAQVDEMREGEDYGDEVEERKMLERKRMVYIDIKSGLAEVGMIEGGVNVLIRDEDGSRHMDNYTKDRPPDVEILMTSGVPNIIKKDKGIEVQINDMDAEDFTTIPADEDIRETKMKKSKERLEIEKLLNER